MTTKRVIGMVVIIGMVAAVIACNRTSGGGAISGISVPAQVTVVTTN